MDNKPKPVAIPSSILKSRYQQDLNEKTFDCKACGETHQRIGLIIRCRNDHIFCPKCSEEYKNYIISEISSIKIPIKCPIGCGSHINHKVLERLFNYQELQLYLSVIVQQNVEENEKQINCIYCGYYEIGNNENQEYFYCSNPKCERVHCLTCKEELPVFQKEELDDEASLKYIQLLEKHSQCKADSKILNQFQDILKQGQQQACPQCKTYGVKDDACTHMDCPACEQIWCYFCGQREEDVAKIESNTIFGHNVNWYCDKNQCPMYLTEIQEVDDRWPVHEDLCLEFFHRKRTIAKLREWVNQIGEEKYKQLESKYTVISSCGYKLEEILSEDCNLIIVNESPKKNEIDQISMIKQKQ